MAVVIGAEHVLLLVVVEVFVHGYRPDVLRRAFVVYDEVRLIVRRQLESHVADEVAVVDGGLPGVHLPVAGFECHLRAVGSHAVSPVVVGIHLGVEHQLGHHEGRHGLCDAAVVVGDGCALLGREEVVCLLQLVDDEAEHLASIGLLHVVDAEVG